MKHLTDGRWSKRRADPRDENRFPNDHVLWQDAVEFSRRLSTWPAEARNGRVYRLPTEADWESASRAGSMTRWAFGNEPGELAKHKWYNSLGQRGWYCPSTSWIARRPIRGAFVTWGMYGRVLRYLRERSARSRNRTASRRPRRLLVRYLGRMSEHQEA